MVETNVSNDKKWLILDLDHTLIHSTTTPPAGINPDLGLDFPDYETYWVKKRPYLDTFLAKVGKHYNLCLFTAGKRCYAEPILAHLMSSTHFCQVMCWENVTQFGDGSYFKDLSKLNIDLEQAILVDDQENITFQVDNHLLIEQFWQGNDHDVELAFLADFLLLICGDKNLKRSAKGWQRFRLQVTPLVAIHALRHSGIPNTPYREAYQNSTLAEGSSPTEIATELNASDFVLRERKGCSCTLRGKLVEYILPCFQGCLA